MIPQAFTVGHGTLGADDFVTLLRGAGIAAVADIRAVPRSRHNPQYNLESMRLWLPQQAGIAYTHHQELGGWRRPAPDSANVALRNPAFRGYADYMQTQRFAAAIEGVIPELAARPTALMCSESVWWRCHRRLVADYLVLAGGWEILDLMHDGRATPHHLTPGVRSTGKAIVYDATERVQGAQPLETG